MSDILQTIGVEIEGVTLDKKSIPASILSSGLITITRDASVETPALFIGSGSRVISPNSKIRRRLEGTLPVTTLGFELVSTPLGLDLPNVLFTTLSKLAAAGEIESERASIHIHVGFPKSLGLQKSMLAVAKRAEALLYRLAPISSPFRGYINHSVYCVPLSIPPAVFVRGVDRPYLLNPFEALKANSQQQFWSHFGINFSMSDRPRYHPARYFGINLYSILLRGTIVYRMCNYSNNPFRILAMALLCRGITELAVFSPKSVEPIPELSLSELSSNDVFKEVLRMFLTPMAKLGIPDNVLSFIEEHCHGIIDTTKQFVFDNQHVQSHVDCTIDEEIKDMAKFRLATGVVESEHIDIHNIGDFVWRMV